MLMWRAVTSDGRVADKIFLLFINYFCTGVLNFYIVRNNHTLYTNVLCSSYSYTQSNTWICKAITALYHPFGYCDWNFKPPCYHLVAFVWHVNLSFHLIVSSQNIQLILGLATSAMWSSDGSNGVFGCLIWPLLLPHCRSVVRASRNDISIYFIIACSWLWSVSVFRRSKTLLREKICR